MHHRERDKGRSFKRCDLDEREVESQGEHEYDDVEVRRVESGKKSDVHYRERDKKINITDAIWRRGRERRARAYVDVMVRKRSCPAVSQICSLTRSPSTSSVRILKSTPMVVM